METKDEPSSCLSTCLIWISGRHSRLSIRNQSQGLWNISNSNLSIWISIARAVECIMIIALNYTSYLHVCLPCVQDGVDLSPVDVSNTRLARLSHRHLLSGHQKFVCRALATGRNQLIIASTSEWCTAFIYHLTDQWPHCDRANISLVFVRDQSRKQPRNIYAEEAHRINIISKRKRRRALRPVLKMATEQVTNRAPSIDYSTYVSYIWVAEVNLAMFSWNVAAGDYSPQSRCQSRDQDENPEGEEGDRWRLSLTP